MIRLIAFDMDGTVLNDEKKILKEINKIINFIQDMKLNLVSNCNLIGKKI